MVKIGLEIHGYLTTKEKLFCRCRNSHKNKETKPNTLICPICTGQPGSKPMLPNSEAIKKVIQIGLMLNCKINILPKSLIWYRKHYSWPDLPKGFQNTLSGTYAVPIGEKGNFLNIGITEVHLEEDPAAWDPETGEIDYNRSGVPLIEIVTDPDFKSSKEVALWLKQTLLTLSYIKALDKDAGIKADVNVSTKGERVEIKNMNSIQEIVKAIEYEIKRQEKEPQQGRETRQWNGEKTIKMRSKESHADYRFIKEPDLPIINLKKEEVEKLKKSLPESPMEKLNKIIKKHKLSEYDANVLVQNLEIADFFEKVISEIPADLAVRWITVELLGTLNYHKKTLEEVDIKTEHFIELLSLVKEKKLTELKAKDILRTWIPKSKPIHLEQQLIISDEKEIEKIMKAVLKENQKAINDYKSGQSQALNFLIGQIMRISNKRADFQTVKEKLIKELKN